MTEPFETERVGRYIIAIYPDPEPSDPTEWDQLGTMLCWHSRYNLGHGGSWGKEHRYDTPEEFLRSLCSESDLEKIEKWVYGIPWKEWDKNWRKYQGEKMNRLTTLAEKHALILPVSLYEHSGMTMWVGAGPHAFDAQGWDSGQVGYIYVTHEKARKEFGSQWRKKAESCLEQEVKSYDDYLTGNCWGYRIFAAPEGVDETFQVDSFDDLDEIDSCWGFLGDKEYCLEEARSLVKSMTKETA